MLLELLYYIIEINPPKIRENPPYKHKNNRVIMIYEKLRINLNVKSHANYLSATSYRNLMNLKKRHYPPLW